MLLKQMEKHSINRGRNMAPGRPLEFEVTLCRIVGSWILGGGIQMAVCCMCGVNRKLVKAHILPESLYPHRVAGTSNLHLYSNLPEFYPKRCPIGIYDESILCDDCERLFNECDTYAAEILRAKPEALDEPNFHFELRNFSYPLLKRFFVGVLWRATVSTQVFFQNVDVGEKHERRLREILHNTITPEPEEYASWLMTFEDRETAKMVLPPVHIMLKSLHVYRFNIAGFSLWIKADQRSTPPLVTDAILRPDRPFKVEVRRWRESREYREVLHLAGTATESRAKKM